MSGAQTSTFANVLYDPLMAGRQTFQENQLAIQQQDIGGHELEMGARLAGTLLSAYDTPEARAAAYPTLLAQARAVAPGYFKNAPAVYPGDEPTKALAQLGTPSADLFKYGLDRQAKGAIAPGDDGTTATGGGGRPATGGGGGTLSGDTYEGAIGGHEGLGADARLPSTVGGFRPSTWQSFVAANPNLFAGMTPEQAAAARSDPKLNAAGISWLARQNADALTKAGVTPSGAALGIAHYLGVGAAAKVLQAPDNAPIRDFVSADAVTYNPELATMTVGQLKQRYARVPSPSFLASTQPSGSPAAPPGVQMGEAAPPPPWGAQGAYGGGGFGAVVGGQPVAPRATIPAGRPTGPPVITDQPAGGGVVAGPPGTVLVGAPQPPSPEVPGNVAAINAGIVARGGQPVTDPNITPTPARYAGTAPAPSVEAQPQPGWGTGIGSGYGPQNTLAPAPVPPTRLAAPAAAQPAAQQTPAADTLPPLPAPTPPAPTNRNGLTPAQQLDINNRRGMRNVSADELQKRVDSYVATNAAVAEKYQQDQIAYVREARERQSAAQAQQDRAQAQQLAREAAQRDADRLRLSQQADQRAADEATQKAKAANRPVQGNDVDAQHESYLYEHANEIRDGTASEEVRRQYAGSYYALQQKGGQAIQITDPNNPGGTIAATITRRLPPSLPEPPGGALPQVFTTPGAAKAPEMTAPQSQAAGFADRMRNALPVISDTSPAAMSRWQQVLGQVPLVGNTYVSADFQRHLQSERDFINAVLRRESGAAISESEFVNARQQYIPQPGDKPPVLADKARNRETVLANLIRDAGPAYRPPTGAATQSTTTTPPSRVIRYDHTGKRIEE